MLFPFKIGSISSVETTPLKSVQSYPIISSKLIQYKNFQIDLTKGLIAQVYKLNKEDYLEFIDNPIHLPYCRLYDSSLMEELITRNKWYYIPIIWGIVVLYLLYHGVFYNYIEISILKEYVWINGESFSWLFVGLAVFCGLVFWTIFEYSLHRFLFHCEWWLPDRRFLLHVHFLLHGIHHAIPMDPY